MATLSEEQVTAVVKESLSKNGNLGDSELIDQISMPDGIRTRIVDYIINKFKGYGAHVILSEEKFKEFDTVQKIIDWCFTNQY